MGFFSWLREVFGGPPARSPQRRANVRCLYCGAEIVAPQAGQCPQCGRRWDESPQDRATHPNSESVGVPAGTKATPTPQSGNRVTRAQLEAGEFAPLTSEEESAGPPEDLGRLSFQRRDRIPSAEDPRVKFVDRAMVSRGLITPERLAEIHSVGEEMDRVAPVTSVFAARADAAVRQDREQRAENKRRKREEAAVRRELRQREIAQRRATDILFLGRGVSRHLGNRNSNVAELKRRALPVLSSPADVAEALQLSIGELRWLAFHNICATRIHYVQFEVTKRSGGSRQLAAPHRKLARCQHWIEHEILNKLSVHEAANGFVKERSIVTNAQPHVAADVIVNLDLRDFFPSITFPRVQGLFRKLGYSPAAATVLALLCTECPRQAAEFAGVKYHVAVGERSLPQGACTSPALSNLIAYKLDCRLAGLAKKRAWNYTRYADDLSFSTLAGDASPQAMISQVRRIVEDEHFSLNEKKSRVLRPSSRQMVTGVVVNERTNAPRKLVRRIRAILHQAKTDGLAAQNRESHANFPAWLEGQIGYISMLNPLQGRRLLEDLRKLQSSDRAP